MADSLPVSETGRCFSIVEIEIFLRFQIKRLLIRG
jgi:hypothetical protein